MYCHKCGKEIKYGSSFCKYCGAKQVSLVKRSLQFVHKRLKLCEMFIIKHFVLIMVLLLITIITLQIVNMVTISEMLTVEKHMIKKQNRSTRETMYF